LGVKVRDVHEIMNFFLRAVFGEIGLTAGRKGYRNPGAF